MSGLDTYADLRATLEDYLERADLAGRIPTFVRLAETRLARRLNLVEGEVTARLDLVAGRAPLPDDYGTMRAVVGWPRVSLDYMAVHAFLALYGGSGLSLRRQGDGYDDEAVGTGPCAGGRLRAYTVVGSVPLDDIDADISIWPAGLDRPFILVGPAGDGAITITYRQTIPPLTDDAPSNWLLRRAPDLYLYAALMEAAPFLAADARIAVWRSLLEDGIADLAAFDRNARRGRGAVVTLEPTP